MQVHYNLLAGPRARPSSATLLRLAPGDTRPRPRCDTMLLPAPVELPCRPGHDASPLCDRDAAVADVMERFGDASGNTANCLHLLCGPDRRRRPVQTCDRHDQPAGDDPCAASPATCTCSAARSRSRSTRARRGRGRSSTSRSGTSTTRAPSRSSRSHLEAGDTVRVTCRHVQWLRDQLPAFEGQPRPVRRVGRGHHRRDVPRHPAGHRRLTALSPTRRSAVSQVHEPQQQPGTPNIDEQHHPGDDPVRGLAGVERCGEVAIMPASSVVSPVDARSGARPAGTGCAGRKSIGSSSDRRRRRRRRRSRRGSSSTSCMQARRTASSMPHARAAQS